MKTTIENKSPGKSHDLDEIIATIEDMGGRMVVETLPGGKMSIAYDSKGTGRTCGTCQLCCKVMPVPPLKKPANKRCDHQRANKGCAVWHSPAMPSVCWLYHCRWLADPSTKGLPRPDRAHYVIDFMPDHITMTDESGKQVDVPVFQVWVDPAFPDAWQDENLKAWMAAMADRHGFATIIRFSSRAAVTVFPPHFDADGQWNVQAGTVKARTPEEREVLNDFSA